MKIKCGKCGNENPAGTVFCRGCGEKLDELTWTMEHSGENGASGSGGIWRNIFHLILVLAILGGGGYGIFLVIDRQKSKPEKAEPAIAEKEADKVDVEKEAEAEKMCPECHVKMDGDICPNMCGGCGTHLVNGKCPSCEDKKQEEYRKSQKKKYADYWKLIKLWEASSGGKNFEMLDFLLKNVPEKNPVITENLPAYFAYGLYAESVKSALAMPYTQKIIRENVPECSGCRGKGRVETDKPVSCSKCRGTGHYTVTKKVPVRRWMEYGRNCDNPNKFLYYRAETIEKDCPHPPQKQVVTCPACSGSGLGLTQEDAKERFQTARKNILSELKRNCD